LKEIFPELHLSEDTTACGIPECHHVAGSWKGHHSFLEEPTQKSRVMSKSQKNNEQEPTSINAL